MKAKMFGRAPKKSNNTRYYEILRVRRREGQQEEEERWGAVRSGISSRSPACKSGRYYECQLLQDYLNNISPKGDVFYNAQNNFLTTEWDSENSQSDDGDYGHVQCKPPCSGPYKRRKITRSDAGSSMSEESYSEVLKLSDEWKIGVPALAVHGRVEISRRA